MNYFFELFHNRYIFILIFISFLFVNLLIMARNKKILIGLAVSVVGGGLYYQLRSNDTYFQYKQSLLTNKTQTVSPYDSAIQEARKIVRRFKNEVGTPGIVVGVSVDGKTVWEEGTGFANLETGTLCDAKTVMRIASISKSITMTLLAKLSEDGKINLDEDIKKYVPYFPKKKVNGHIAIITPRLLACHKAGIRHYKKDETKKKEIKKAGDSNYPEFYLTTRFNNIEDSVGLFKNDDLLFKPGESFHYTTHGYTLLSAAIEGAMSKPFATAVKELFYVLGLKHTYLDEVSTIVPYRASYYTKDDKGRVINAELADTSYKWAGGGFLSDVSDLQSFGNIMLYCYQQRDTNKTGYLKQTTVKEMWTSVEGTKMSWDPDAGYGLGWVVVPPSEKIGGIENKKFLVGHAGGAVGASSVLVIVPREVQTKTIPNGVVVAILVNLESISLHKVAKEIADLFYKESDAIL